MIDQRQSNAFSKVFGCFFLALGIAMLCIGIPFISISNKDETEMVIMILAIASGILLLVGGYQTIKYARQKNKALDLYKNEIASQLTKGPGRTTISEKTALAQTPVSADETYKPEIIARWNYTREEWKMMNTEERNRRLKEGILVSLLIGLFGGWILSSSRDTTFWFGFLFSLAFGIFVSLLKVLISGRLFSSRDKNYIIITTNALIINGKFKTIQDDHIHLEYLKPLELEGYRYLEFSLEWQTRRGMTNDQFRIYVPPVYLADVEQVVNFYRDKGVRIEGEV